MNALSWVSGRKDVLAGIFCVVFLVCSVPAEEINFTRHEIGVFNSVDIVELGDIDGDGDLDAVVGSNIGGDGLRWWSNDDGLGGSWTVSTIRATPGVTTVDIGDMDGDGDMDVITSIGGTGATINFHENLGGGLTWTARVVSTSGVFADVDDVVIGDFNGDGDLDVAAAGLDNDSVAWFDNVNGDGSIWILQSVDTNFNAVQTIGAHDFDRDGNLDLVAGGADTIDIQFYLNTSGLGSVWETRGNFTTTVPAILGGADMNCDGLPDLLVGGTGLSGYYEASGLLQTNWTSQLWWPNWQQLDVADLDHDGDLDAIGVSQPADDLYWIENLPGDGFGTWSNTVVDGTIASWVDVGDIDGDGDLDLISAGGASNDIAWFESDLASLQSGYTKEIVIRPSAIGALEAVTGDIDRDGDLDVVSVSTNLGNIFWHENEDGKGTNWIGNLITGSFDDASGVAVGDMNRDGLLDVLVVSELQGRLAWWENDADGSNWTLRVISASAGGVRDVFPIDMDRDGDLDVVSVATLPNGVDWWENQNGMGTSWSAPQSIAGALSGSFEVDVRDFDQDGDPDVMIAARNAGILRWRENTDGVGGAWATRNVATNFTQARSVSIADYDGDGDLDVAAAAEGLDTVAWFERTDAAGTSWTRHDILTNFSGAADVYAVDLDLDGDPDLAAASLGDHDVIWLENRQNGSVWLRREVELDFDGARSVTAADMDKDGRPDLVAAGEQINRVSWWPNAGPAPIRLNGFRALDAVDLDCDGDPDLLGAGQEGNGIAWFENVDGSDTNWVRIGVALSLTEANSVSHGDLNGDGQMDVLGTAAGNDLVGWWENDGTLTNWISHTINNSYPEAADAVAADIDKDGDLDVVGVSPEAGQVHWFENTTGVATQWTAHVVQVLAWGINAVAAADVDQDGDMDIVTASTNAGGRVVFHENADGVGGSWTIQGAASGLGGACAVDIADMDGDGDLDIAAAACGDGNVVWWENIFNGIFSAVGTEMIASNFTGASSVAARDVDRDGDMDIIASAETNDEVSVWFNVGGSGTNWIREDLDTDLDGASAVVLADIDLDGDPDYVAAGFLEDRARIYFNDDPIHDVNWPLRNEVDDGLDDIREVEAVDMDQDGDLDLLTAVRDNGEIQWWRNSNNGASWLERKISSTATQAQDVYPADADCDGDLDVFAAFGSELTLFLNDNGSGTSWTTQQIITIDFALAQGVHAADLDGDGDIDVIGASRGDDKIVVARNLNSLGTSWDPVVLSTNMEEAYSVHAADIDKDGDLDVIGCARSFTIPNTLDDRVAWFENVNGDAGTWVEHAISDDPGREFITVFPLDMDHDGDVDVLTSGHADTVQWYENIDGTGGSWETNFISLGSPNSEKIRPGDLDGDGDIDIAMAGFGSSTKDVIWLENLGGATQWQDHVVNSGFTNMFAITLSDINQDGTLDIVAGGADGTEALYWWPNQQASLAITKTTSTPILDETTNVVYTLVVTNFGSTVLTNIVVEDDLPGSIVWESDTAGAGPPVLGLLTWSIDQLNAGESTSLVINANVSGIAAVGERINEATVFADGSPGLDEDQAALIILDSDGDGLANWFDSDDDNDKIPDTWEVDNGLDKTNSNVLTDSDDDAVLDYSEYIADTDPLDSNDFLQVTALSNIASFAVTFTSSTNRVYELQFNEDMVNQTNGWVVLGTPVTGDVSGVTTLVDPASTNTRAYRIRALEP